MIEKGNPFLYNFIKTGRDAMHCVSTKSAGMNPEKNKFGPQSKNLASIVRGLKIAVTKKGRVN
jgi:hypothetical protein